MEPNLGDFPVPFQLESDSGPQPLAVGAGQLELEFLVGGTAGHLRLPGILGPEAGLACGANRPPLVELSRVADCPEDSTWGGLDRKVLKDVGHEHSCD